MIAARRLRLLGAAASLALPAVAMAAEQASPTTSGEDILVVGNRYILGILPERDLDAAGIESYGDSTIDQLVADVQGELGDDEPPLILVNGERVADVGEVGGLPVEALANVKVLPRGSAVRAGGSARQRIVSLTLQRQVRSATALLAPKVATDGEWSTLRGEGILTFIRGDTRANATLKHRREGDLLESERGIDQPAAAPAALGDFRTLRPRARSDDLNATLAARLADWLTGSLAARVGHSARRSLRGLPEGVTGFAGALTTKAERDSGDLTLSLNARLGRWTGFLTARHDRAVDVTLSERAELGTVDLDRAEARSRSNQARLSFNGPLAALPAGDALATVEAQWLSSRLKANSDAALDGDERVRRRQSGLRGAIELPLTASDGFGGAIGDLSATGELAIDGFSDARSITSRALGLSWQPRRALRLSADWEWGGAPASVGLLGNPLIVTSGVRTFDPLTGESVDVTQISGGNPDLAPERTRVTRLAALVRPIERLNLQASAEYTDSEERNFVSFLPDASAAVMLAFPERFVRDGGGQLVSIDLRPVNFDRHREQRLRYGFSLFTRFGAGGGAATGEEDDGAGPLRLQLSANHAIVFKDEIAIRPGLDDIDLLEGGAIGIAGGRTRHQLDGSLSLSRRGMGLRLNANWRGRYTLESRVGDTIDELRFSPVLLVNARLFTDMRHLLPGAGWARGLRLSVNADNIFNDRQEVRDPAGNTPLQYQPGYRDPLGRTLELELRKVF